MKKSILLSAIMITGLSALDFRIGKGSYDADVAIKSFMNHNTTHDTWVFTLSQPHTKLNEKGFFYYGDLEFLTSDTKRQSTEFANFAANYQFPLVGSVNDMTNSFIDMFPVDGDYQAIGFDVDFGLGYDVLRKGDSYLGIALNVGATLPTIDASDLSSKVDFAYDLVQSWELDITTYKIGPSLKGVYALTPEVSLYGSFSLGFQKGAVKSGLLKSSVDVNGDYNALDLGVKYQAKSAPYYLQLGHTSKHWNVDSVEVNLYNFFQADVFRPFSAELESSVTYLGVGYRF